MQDGFWKSNCGLESGSPSAHVSVDGDPLCKYSLEKRQIPLWVAPRRSPSERSTQQHPKISRRDLRQIAFNHILQPSEPRASHPTGLADMGERTRRQLAVLALKHPAALPLYPSPIIIRGLFILDRSLLPVATSTQFLFRDVGPDAHLIKYPQIVCAVITLVRRRFTDDIRFSCAATIASTRVLASPRFPPCTCDANTRSASRSTVCSAL